ncbi:MAG TPA: bifunctional DNA-binding transcriptional regulator/O6-methylguanine-DNA methyltransferase Ada [Beijerinckiaceae bacterium]|nr:bifunctional DNA-binding transcriptional regulator/O6-methylguanine-DNA methyltransferase Ada [Beijerinckiaceae bacterium]
MSIAIQLDTGLSEEDSRWKFVSDRDASSDHAFVYAVKTTGVYCRPSCPSRMPNRCNVVFYANPAEAESHGYRACLRCNPKGKSSSEAAADVVAKACRTIETAAEMPKLEELATSVGLSPFHFHRQFKAVTGLTPRAYRVAQRAKRVRAELSDRESSVTGAIYGAGFNSSSRFYETSADVLGMTPSNFRRGGKDADIHFAVGECSLGAILVARSDRGVCAISLGDDPDRLVRDLQDSFPNAQLIGADREFEQVVAQVVGFIEEPRAGLDLPLDIRGSAFQERVWQALREIPVGATASYADIARRLGAPSAVRAVAQACGANKIAVAIPCHRVVRADATLSGYRWGIERKRALLEKEKRA